MSSSLCFASRKLGVVARESASFVTTDGRAVLYPIEQRATYAHHEREARFRDVAVRAHASDVLAKHGREPALIRLVIIQRTMFVLGLHVH